MEQGRFKKMLRDSNVSVTTAREAIFATLLGSDRPLKKGEVAALTKTVNRASVYRTLDLFEELGITTTMVRGWTPFVELADPFKPHHHHLECLNCQQLIALDYPELEQLVEKISSEYGYALLTHHVELQGLCPKCRLLAS
jgi:Fur family ferric uptake transcriptional regulator